MPGSTLQYRVSCWSRPGSQRTQTPFQPGSPATSILKYVSSTIFKRISRRGAFPDWQIHRFSLLIAYHLSFLILYTYFHCRYLVVKFAYNSSGATWWSNSSGGTWWPNVQPIQALPPGGRIWNYQLSHQRHITYWLCDLYEESLQVYTWGWHLQSCSMCASLSWLSFLPIVRTSRKSSPASSHSSLLDPFGFFPFFFTKSSSSTPPPWT